MPAHHLFTLPWLCVSLIRVCQRHTCDAHHSSLPPGPGSNCSSQRTASQCNLVHLVNRVKVTTIDCEDVWLLQGPGLVGNLSPDVLVAVPHLAWAIIKHTTGCHQTHGLFVTVACTQDVQCLSLTLIPQDDFGLHEFCITPFGRCLQQLFLRVALAVVLYTEYSPQPMLSQLFYRFYGSKPCIPQNYSAGSKPWGA